MAYSIRRVPVQLGKEADVLSLGLRFVAADYIRGLFRTRFDGAVMAGVDRHQAAQKFAMLWTRAARASKIVRDVPASVVQWCGNAEFQAADPTYPVPEAKSVGTFNKDCLTVLPGSVIVVKIGGIMATGVMTADQAPIPMHEVSEIRIRAVGDLDYEAVIVIGRSDAAREDEEVPLPGELQPVEG